MTAFKFAQKYLLFSLPFVLICMAWGSFQNELEIHAMNVWILNVMWEILSWNLLLWFLTLIVYLLAIVAWPEGRDAALKRLARIHESDEREEYITGRASRSAYISTIAMLIFLLFFSVFSFNVARVPADQAVNGKTGNMSISLGGNLLDEPRIRENTSQQKTIFEYSGLPLSKTGVILLLITWQLGSFALAARREAR